MSVNARCPDCRTAFTISPAQLQAADGLVRCGACLAVFAATAHLVSPAADPGAAARPASPPASQFPRAHTTDPEAAQQAPHEEDVADYDDEEGWDDEDYAAYEEDDGSDDPPRRPLWQIAGLVLLNGALLLTLAAQLAWLNRERLVESPRLRPLLAWTCARLPCAELPLFHAAAFQAEELDVTPHPERPDALRVTFALRNGAPWAQPLPLLELRFLDPRGRVLASRRFRPAEYLPAEARSLATLAPGRPLRITLDVLDPGPVALDHDVIFHAP